MDMSEHQQAVGAKFQAWAESLSPSDQQVLAGWWQQLGRGEVEGYSAQWWTEPGAWSARWNESWNW
jgi:hypothetical protein